VENVYSLAPPKKKFWKTSDLSIPLLAFNGNIQVKFTTLHFTSLKDLIPYDIRQNDFIPESQMFLAISHIWADGLGNPRADAVHKFQPQRIQVYAND
jgi:hypothetical protein